MKNFKIGDEISVPCDIGRGAFPGEFLVTLESVSGPLSGFVKEEEIICREESNGLVRATIHGFSEDTLSIWIKGSFFQTTGLAHLPQEWARTRVQSLQ